MEGKGKVKIMKKRIVILIALILGLVIAPNSGFTLNIQSSDIFLTPETDDFLGGYLGGLGVWDIDWSIANSCPFSAKSDDMVFSTCIGNYSDPANWIERMRITNEGNIGIGTTSPESKLSIEGEEVGEVCIQMTRHGVLHTSPGIVMEKSRGTTASPSVVVEGDNMGWWLGRGYDGENYINGANIRMEIDGITGTNNMPGRIVFETTAEGNSMPTERMRIDSSGNIGIGTTSPGAKLDLVGNIAINGTTVIDTDGKWVGDPNGLSGPQGPQGIQGPQGDTGPQGPQGPQGIQGSAGADGADGTNGAPGADVADGQDGAPGADGDSAYQIWLYEGNTGTEADFLASLKGDKGDDGMPGADGADGEDGAKGDTGAQGPPGECACPITQEQFNELTARIEYLESCYIRFTDMGDGTIRDNNTGLLWLKNANCFGEKSWDNAMAAADSLANGQCDLTDGSVAGEWRLPTKAEWGAFCSTLDNGPALESPALVNTVGNAKWSEGDAFTGVRVQSSFQSAGNYWSSTEWDTDSAYYVNMVYGSMHPGNKDDPNALFYVWPVRSDN